MIINRYITKEVIYVMLAVLSVLVLIFLCTEFSRYLQQAAEGNIPTSALLKLLGIAVPALVSLLLPLAYFLGLLLGYGRLYVDNEMTVMQACGFSQRQLLRVTMRQAIIISLIVAVLMFWMVPYLSRYKDKLLASGGSESILQTVLPGQFQSSPSNKQVFYIEKLNRNRKTLEGVFMAEYSTVNTPSTNNGSNHSWDILYSKTAYQTHNDKTGENYFTTSSGYRYIGAPGAANYMIIRYGTYSLKIPSNANVSPSTKAQALKTIDLLKSYSNPVNAAEFQWRAALPISVILMALLAVPLSRVRPRQGRFVKLLPAIFIYIVYANMLYVARSWVVQGFVPISVGMWWIHLALLGVIGLFYIDKQRGGKRWWRFGI